MDDLVKYFKYENGTNVVGLTNELNVFYVLNLFKKTNKDILVVTSSLYEANKYYNLFQTYTEDVLLYLMDDFVSSALKVSSPELKLTRLNTLDKIGEKPHIVIANLMGFLSFLPSKENVSKSTLILKLNSVVNRDNLVSSLIDLGYKKESLTTLTGEFSVRGMIVDIFAINEHHPIRIEFDGDIIEDIRYFDEQTQCKINSTDAIVIKPIVENLSKGASSLYEYMAHPTVIYIDKPLIKSAYKHIQEDIFNYSQNAESVNLSILNYEDIDISYEISLDKFNSNLKDSNQNCMELENFHEDFSVLKNFVINSLNDHKKVVFALSLDKQIKQIKEVCTDLDVKIIKQKINKGFIFNDLVVIGESDIGSIYTKSSYQNNLYGYKKVMDYNDLQIGDYIVHISHGIGIYNGLVTLTKGGIKKDYIQLLYLDNDKIYVPVEKISSIYKYSDKDGSIPKLNRLNSTSWLKTRKYVQKKIEDLSKELMALYKARYLVKSQPYKIYEEESIFETDFPYNLTKDQSKAINDITSDLTSTKPMDRLLCGDVGFGKTEVAMRAMFKAVINNKQVIYLCPTTILSKQQYNVALKRFKNWPIEIALLNRFTTAKEEKAILDGLASGKIDIVFGTHKLFNDKITYKNLDLMIVDEEQRFGVKHKEKIKEMKNELNVLTLSATPIPRTLKMALSGLRDLSIIDTPPLNRYPVQTYVISQDDLIIKDAIYKELSRDGQVFILYNNVENIENKVNSLKKLIPDEEIRYGHGQMSKDDLDSLMDDFVNHKFNIIVCTTIIENGIDIPNANTLIIYDADRLGLSQLYQLRGRVGRSDKVAYAYLMYNPNKMLNDIAIKRLNAIKEFTALGSGYRIAMKDLSIRGAGDIFGSSQAGFIDSVGISLYTKMLDDELKKSRGELVIDEDETENESLISVDTHIDNAYVSDEKVKIEIHKMINEIDSYDKLLEIKEVISERFGKISEDLENYMYEEWFEKLAQKLKITEVKQNGRMIEVTLPKQLSDTIKGDKLLYNSYSICPSFNLAYKNGKIIITLYYKNLKEHFIRYIVRLLETL